MLKLTKRFLSGLVFLGIILLSPASTFPGKNSRLLGMQCGIVVDNCMVPA